MSYTNKTISQHIDFLADAFLIEKAQRYDIKGRKYIGANLKYTSPTSVCATPG